jgi:hypothetical protein
MSDKSEADPWDFLTPHVSSSSTESESVEPAETPKVEADGDDPWSFLTARKAEVAARDDSGSVPEALVEKREAGEFRADMGGESLKRRALPMALCLALVSVAGFLTETVAATQLVSLAGATSLFIVYPLGGLGLIVLALIQFRFVDQKARLKVLRLASLLYAVAFIITLIMLGSSVAPIICIAIVYLLGDQLNFLVPLLIWSLAGDEFNVAEGRKVFGWIIAWTYGGQLLGLAIAASSPFAFSALNLPLPLLLLIDPIVCIFVGLWLPLRLKGTFAAKGLNTPESLKTSLAGAWDFINGVPIWRTFLLASTITFIGGMTVFLSFMTGEGELIGSDAGQLQFFFGSVMLASLIMCLLLQIFFAEKLQDRIGIPGVLIILPVMTVLAGILLACGIAFRSYPLLALGLAAWFIPRWSVDENARRAALALVPDERRTRVSFIVDLLPISVGLIIAGPLAALGLLAGQLWVIPALGALITIFAIPLALRVRRGWEDSLLNWRLRRRKQNRSIVLGEE